MLYIAIVRYVLSIASYVAVVVAFMLWAAVGPFAHGMGFIMLAFLAALHAVVGFTIGRPWALGLVLLVPLLALPVPVPEDAYEPIPMWFAMLYFGIPVGLVLVGLGLIARVFCDWLRSPRPA